MKLKAYAAATHQGPFLEVNEDAYDFDLDQRFFLVLDGFGGSGVGDKAVERLKEDLKAFLGRLTSDPDATMPLYWSQRWLLEGNALVNSILNAHQALVRENSTKDLNQRAGASGACALMADDILVLAQVGNCQAYLIRRGKAEALFVPDTHALLSPDHRSPRALHIPASAFGLHPDLTWSMREVRIQQGDQFVLLTDGVAPWVSAEELPHLLSRLDSDAQARLRGLMKLSNDRGNCSNQTGLVLEF